MTTPIPSLASFFASATLTADQQTAIAALEQFIADDNQHIFILRGYAGTGKTFLMKGVTQWLKAYGYDLLLTAPTGRAAKVLQHNTGMSASTVHRAIYAFGAEDADTLHTRFDLTDREVAEDQNPLAIIVDEASMLGDVLTHEEEAQGASYGSGRLLADYIRHAGFGKFKGTKMILVGDEAQLPPVKMDFSPALSTDYLFIEYGIAATEAVLRQVVRQEDGSDLLATATSVRNALHTGQMPQRVPVVQTRKDGGIRNLPTDRFADQYIRLNHLPKPTGQVVILAHTNEQIECYNRAIRKHYFPECAEVVAEGDILVVGHNVYGGSQSLSNGEIIRIVGVGRKREETISAPRGKIKPSKDGFVTYGTDTISARFVWRHVRAEVRIGSGAIVQFDHVLLEHVLFGAGADLPWAATYLLKSDARNRFYQANKRLYATDKAEFERLRNIFVWNDPYANALRCRFGYALTCHKAQGGEWKHVLVDMRSFMQHLDDKRGYYRWAYTAITRARVCAWLGFVEHQCANDEARAKCEICRRRNNPYPKAPGKDAKRRGGFVQKPVLLAAKPWANKSGKPAAAEQLGLPAESPSVHNLKIRK